MKEAIIKLIKVKSLLSIVCAALMVYCTVTGKIDGKDAMVIISMIFTYYFTRKNEGAQE